MATRSSVVIVGGNLSKIPATDLLGVGSGLTAQGTSAPEVSSEGSGRIYFDSSSNTFKVSQNGQAYTDLLGGQAQADQTLEFSCLSTVAVGDVVGISASGTVSKVTASGSTHAIGVVQEKPSSTVAKVLVSGLSTAIFSGLTPGAEYYLSAAGALTTTAPSGLSGTFVQKLGVAAETDRLLVSIGPPYSMQTQRDSVTMAVDESTELSTFTVLGAFSVGAGLHALEFETVASVSGAELTGEVQLWSLTSMAQVALHTVTALAPTKASTSVTVPTTDTVFEVRHRVTGGASPTDLVNTAWAGLRLVTLKPAL